MLLEVTEDWRESHSVCSLSDRRVEQISVVNSPSASCPGTSRPASSSPSLCASLVCLRLSSTLFPCAINFVLTLLCTPSLRLLSPYVLTKQPSLMLKTLRVSPQDPSSWPFSALLPFSPNLSFSLSAFLFHHCRHISSHSLGLLSPSFPLIHSLIGRNQFEIFFSIGNGTDSCYDPSITTCDGCLKEGCVWCDHSDYPSCVSGNLFGPTPDNICSTLLHPPPHDPPLSSSMCFSLSLSFRPEILSPSHELVLWYLHYPW